MHLKSIAVLGFAAALSAFATAPASANTSTDILEASIGTSAQLDGVAPFARCGCGRRYVRYYRVVPVRYVYRYRVVRYYY
jgi:hypothetical protein